MGFVIFHYTKPELEVRQIVASSDFGLCTMFSAPLFAMQFVDIFFALYCRLRFTIDFPIKLLLAMSSIRLLHFEAGIRAICCVSSSSNDLLSSKAPRHNNRISYSAPRERIAFHSSPRLPFIINEAGTFFITV